MPLAAYIAVPPRRRPHIRAAHTHHNVDALFNRVDKTIRKRNVRLQLRVLLNKRQNHRQRLQTSEGGGQINSNPTTWFGVFGLQR